MDIKELSDNVLLNELKRRESEKEELRKKVEQRMCDTSSGWIAEAQKRIFAALEQDPALLEVFDYELNELDWQRESLESDYEDLEAVEYLHNNLLFDDEYKVSRYIFAKDGLYGLLDADGKVSLAAKYDLIKSVKEYEILTYG